MLNSSVNSNKTCPEGQKQCGLLVTLSHKYRVKNEDKFTGIPESLYEIKKTIMQAMIMSCEYIQKFKTTQIEVIIYK